MGNESTPPPTVWFDLALVVALLALAVGGIVRSGGDDDTALGAGTTGPVRGSGGAAAGAGATSDPGTGTGGASGGTGRSTSVRSAGTSADGGASSVDGTTAEVAVPRPANVESDAGGADPLATPDCDAERGRVLVPSFYAPNCVPWWPEGADNGGATYQGISGDTVLVVDYQIEDQNAQVNEIVASTGFEDDTSDEEDSENLKMVIEAFDAHFETYGRKVEVVELKASGPPSDCEAGRSDAIKVASEIKAFASLGTPANTFGGVNCYTEELVARGVLCIGCGVTWSQKLYDEFAPYAWSSQMNYDQAAALLGEYAGKRLWGREAKWAGDPLLTTQTRKLGLITYDSSDGIYANAQELFQREFQRFGAHIATSVGYVFDAAEAQEHSRTMIAKLKDAGTTTVVMAVDPIYPIFITKEATNQRYFPEWLIFGAAIVDTALFARTYDQTQWSHAFGQGFITARVTEEVDEGEPNIVDWHCGCTLSSYPNYTNLFFLYSGLHLTGPVVDPMTFRDGVFSLLPVADHITRYGWSYGEGLWPWLDYVAIDDVTEIWWDANARGPDELGADGLGMYRYVAGGKRYTPGTWPTTEPAAFDPEGTVLMYEERPPGDELPMHEHDEALHR